jgi:hypothetical protein
MSIVPGSNQKMSKQEDHTLKQIPPEFEFCLLFFTFVETRMQEVEVKMQELKGGVQHLKVMAIARCGRDVMLWAAGATRGRILRGRSFQA